MEKSISFLIDGIFSKLSKDSKELFVLYRLSKAWNEFVPSLFANLTFPLKLSVKEIVIAVSSNAVGSQLYYHKAEILSKICSYFGNNAITDIKFVLKPIPLPQNKNRRDVAVDHRSRVSKEI